MNWEMVSALGAIAVALLSAWNSWVITRLKLYIAEQKEELREWIEERYMRGSEVEARFEALERPVRGGQRKQRVNGHDA